MASFRKTRGLVWAPIVARYALGSLMIYLTDKWDFSSTKAAAIINSFWGITDMMQFVMLFCEDAFIGNYRMALFSGCTYTFGLCILSTSITINQEIPFFIALVVLSVGISSCEVISLDKLDSEDKIDHSIPLEEPDLEGNIDSISSGKVGAEGNTDSISLDKLDPEDNIDHSIPLEEANLEGKLGPIDSISLDKLGLEASIHSISSDELNPKENTDLNSLRELGPEGNMDSISSDEVGPEGNMAKYRSKARNFFRKHEDRIILSVVHLVGAVVFTFMDLSYGINFWITTLCMGIAALVFCYGSSSYNHVEAQGSPLATKFKEAYTWFRNWLVRSSLPNGNEEEQQRNDELERTTERSAMRKRRFLVCISFFFLGIISALEDTYFIKQADTMNSTNGPSPFILQMLYSFADFVSSEVYKRMIIKRVTNIDRKKYAGCAGISMCMIIAIFCCFTAAHVESERLHMVKSNTSVEITDYSGNIKTVSKMTTFWLLPQFILLGGLDGISSESIDALFSNDPAERMDPYLTHLAKGALGFGKIGNVLVVFMVGKASAWRGGTSWFGDTLDKSRLDLYCWVLAAMTIANFVYYIIVYYWHDLWKTV